MNRRAYEVLRAGAPYVDRQDHRGRALHLDAGGRLWGCALGAMAIAMRGDPAGARRSRAYLAASRERYWQLLTAAPDAGRPCPGRGRWPWRRSRRNCDRVSGLANQVAHLNDRHGWSFERIADWLERDHPDWEVPVESPAVDGPTLDVAVPDGASAAPALPAVGEPRVEAREPALVG